jgi:hypothetical protein
MPLADPAQLQAQQVQHGVPGHRDELVPAAPVVRAGASLQPTAAYHGLNDPRAVVKRSREVLEDFIRIRISRMWADQELAIPDRRGEDAPVRAVRAEIDV